MIAVEEDFGRLLATLRLFGKTKSPFLQFRGRALAIAKMLAAPRTDSSAAYGKAVPVGRHGVKLLEVCGKAIVWNQLVSNGDFADGATGWTGRNGSLTADNGVLTYTVTTDGGTSKANCRVTHEGFSAEAGHILYLSCEFSLSAARRLYFTDAGNTTAMNVPGYFLRTTPQAVDTWYHLDGVIPRYNVSSGKSAIFFGVEAGKVGDILKLKNVVSFDLTAMFGAGNEPTAEQFRAMFPDVYYAHNTGSLLSAGVTSIVSKDADATTLDAYDIPAEVQALTGYGWSAGTAYNYVDFAGKKFVQAVGSRAHASGDEADPAVVTDGTTTYYALTTPAETDISAYLAGDATLEVAGGGAMVFVNQHGDGYRIPVPSSVEFTI